MDKLILTICGIYMFIFTIKFTLATKIDENEIKTWVTNFKHNLEGHVDRVLAVKEIENNLKKYNKYLVTGKINGSEVFSAMFQSVSIRYTDVERALVDIKSAIEKSASPTAGPVPPGGGPPLLVPPGQPALSGNGGPPLSPPGLPGVPPVGLTRCCNRCAAKKYSGRFRDEICEKECYENVDETLKTIASSGLADTFKNNLEKYPAVSWQYFADEAGHYIQYPTNDRTCDKSTGNISTPLVQEWFVEKLHMERKNLVILLDNGISTGKEALPGKPQTKGQLIKDAVGRSLKTLTDHDKVNVVAFPSLGLRTEVVGPCTDRLYVATERNKDHLLMDLQQLQADQSEPNLQEGLKKAYELLEMEKDSNEASFEQRSNIVLLIMNGESKHSGIEEKQILEMIAIEQGKLNHSVQHFVYTLGQPKDSSYVERLGQIADQNNLKLNRSSGIAVKPWPKISVLVNSSTVVGKEGLLDVVTDPLLLPSRVATYFQRLPPQVDKEQTLIAPQLDPKLGVSMTLAQPVYNLTTKQVLGVAAVDASVAVVFSEIANFDIGENSYAFLFETNNGNVVLHPKLRDPDETGKNQGVFPTLELIEPDLNSTHIQELHRATEKMQQFDTKVHDVQTLSIGKTSISRQPLPATVYYQLIGGTRLCVVFVHLHVDSEEAKKQIGQPGVKYLSFSKWIKIKVPKQTVQKLLQPHRFSKCEPNLKLHAPYHRIDKLFGSPVGNQPSEVCALERHYVSFKDSVIKLSPSVYQDPESYKYSQESLDNITALNSFLTSQTASRTGLIRIDLESLIQHTVRSTQYLDRLWTSSAKEVIERFYGTPTGVFRVYPGIPLPNTYDHIKSEWYRRSLSYPKRTVYHRGRLSWANRQDVIIISRALIDDSGYGRLQGVLGMTVTPRFLTSLLVKGAKDCYASDKLCHIVDDKGDLIDSFHDASPSRHITAIYPWLAEKLRSQNKMQVDWCTGFSDGYHKMTFTLDKVDSSDVTNGDQCQQFKLQHIPNTNIHLLVLVNRTIAGCDDLAIQPCSCTPVTSQSLPSCQYCYGNLGGKCQCKCSCDTDFDQCQDTYNFINASFPKQACFYEQLETTRQDLLPDVPSPMVPHCPIPCVAVENTSLCKGLHHCKLSQETYPSCIWKRDDEYNSTDVSYYFPIPTPKAPPTPPPGIKTTKPKVSHGSGPPSPKSRPPQSSTAASNKTPPKKPLITSSRTGAPPTLKPSPPTVPAPTIRSSPALVSSNSKSTKVSTSPVGHVTRSSVDHVTSSLRTRTSSHRTTGSLVASTQRLNKSEDDSDGGLSPGGIAAIVIAILAAALITVFVVIKLYGKKFRRPGADESSKYLQGSSMFDSTLFNRSQDTVTIGAAPSSTIPYQEM